MNTDLATLDFAIFVLLNSYDTFVFFSIIRCIVNNRNADDFNEIITLVMSQPSCSCKGLLTSIMCQATQDPADILIMQFSQTTLKRLSCMGKISSFLSDSLRMNR